MPKPATTTYSKVEPKPALDQSVCDERLRPSTSYPFSSKPMPVSMAKLSSFCVVKSSIPTSYSSCVVNWRNRA